MYAVAPLIEIVGGLAVAFLGRKLIWLIIAAAAFVLTFNLSIWLFGDSTVSLVIAIVVGGIAAYFATRFANLLINIAGFILVGNAALVIYGWLFPTDQIWIVLLVFVIGGLIGLGLIRYMFAIALIIISALGGATMVTAGMQMLGDSMSAMSWMSGPIIMSVVGVVVALFGFIYQYGVLKAESSRS